MSHIFISYNHKDIEYAHKLADTLQGLGIKVWIDARLDYGSQWPQEIQKQLDACDAFILIMSPHSFASEWVQSELQRAKRKLKPIFPVMLEGDEPWLSVESTQYYDVRSGELPEEEFYSDLKRVLSADRAVQSFSQTQTFARKSVPEKNNDRRNKGKIFAGVLGGCAVIVSIYLVTAGLFFQRMLNNEQPSVFPTKSEVTTVQPSPLENIAASTASALIPTSSISTDVLLPVQLPEGSKVMMISPSGDKYTYTLLSAQRKPLSPDKYLLQLRVRAETDSTVGMNLFSSSFYLRVDDQELATVSFVNEIFARGAAVEVDVEFEIDASAQDAVLLFTVGSNHSDSWATKELQLIFPLENIMSPAGSALPLTIPISTDVLLPVQLPDGSEVMMIAPGGDKYTYTILSAQREPFPPDKYLLHLRVRAETDSTVGMNLFSSSFYLRIGDQELATVSFVNEIFARGTAVEVDVEFGIDPSTKEAVLLVTVGRNHEDSWATRGLRLIFP